MRKFFIALIAGVILGLSVPIYAATNAHFATGLIGGAVTDIDYVDGDTLNDGDFALVMSGSSFYVYRLDASSGATESSPYIISPDTNAGTKRWIQQMVPWVSSTGEMFLPSNQVKDPQRLPWNVGLETEAGLGYSVEVSNSQTIRVWPFSGADAWTALATGSLADVNQVVADDTYVTVTNVTSGSGILTNLILPGVTAASDIVSVKITVDGTEYELAFTADNATDRFFSGIVSHGDETSYPQSLAEGPGGNWNDADLVSGIAFRRDNGGQSSVIVGDPITQMSSSPCVRFETSLKIEMKSSDYTTTNNRDDCAAIYILDQY